MVLQHESTALAEGSGPAHLSSAQHPQHMKFCSGWELRRSTSHHGSRAPSSLPVALECSTCMVLLPALGSDPACCYASLAAKVCACPHPTCASYPCDRRFHLGPTHAA